MEERMNRIYRNNKLNDKVSTLLIGENVMLRIMKYLLGNISNVQTSTLNRTLITM